MNRYLAACLGQQRVKYAFCWTTLFFLFLFLGGVESSAKVIYVNCNLTQASATNGLAWDAAFTNIASAIKVSTNGDQIWVAAGIYTPITSLTSGVALYGGFSGTETNLNQRNWSLNKTILFGIKSYSVVSIKNGNENTRVDGFLITGGKTISGGGIYCLGGMPTIANNRIYGNFADGFGAGIACDKSDVIITNNIIVGNGTNFNSNTIGGGISISSGSPIIANNLISGNISASSGGIDIVSNDDPLIMNNVITENSAIIEGGGIATRGTCRIIGNTILNNGFSSTNERLHFGGGGISIYSASNSIVANNLIKDNSLPDASPMKGSGIMVTSNCVVKIVNNTILNNSGGNGGSFVFVPSPTNTNSVVANNLIACNASGIEMNSGLQFEHNCVYSNGTNDFIGISSPIGTHGNISANPLLIQNTNSMTTLLLSNSPCRNAGNNELVVSNYNDVFNLPRIMDGHVDIGAQEIQSDVVPILTKVVRVSLNGNDENDGSSWAQPKRHIQVAIDSLITTGGEIWVQEGTYYEKLYLNAFVHLFGGFSGSETNREQRNWFTHESILDGENTGTVVTITGVGDISTLDGFTICNGNAGTAYGGGIAVISCAPIITHNLISNNVALSGAGICIGNSLGCVVDANRIVNNKALRPANYSPFMLSIYGGGIMIFAYNANPNVIVRNNLITDNSADGLAPRSGYGGGVYWCGNGQMMNNTFLRNSSLMEGTNSATSDNGGQIYSEGGYVLSTPDVIINNVFSEIKSGIVVKTSKTSNLIISHNIFNGTNSAAFVIPASRFDTNSNLFADPLLLETNGIAILLAGSPCINAGDNSVASIGDMDLMGNPRISGNSVDIGSVEYQAAAAPCIQSVQLTPEGSLSLQLTGFQEADCVLQVTTDFKNWDNLATNRSATFTVPIEKASQSKQRFFRVIQHR